MGRVLAAVDVTDEAAVDRDIAVRGDQRLAADLSFAARHIHRDNRKWWVSLETGEPISRNVGELLCLIHGEISEAMEGHRKAPQGTARDCKMTSFPTAA